MPTDEQRWEHVKREWEQAWSQSRHLETMRGQYLGFFFTIVLGVTVVAAPKIADDSLRTSGSILIVVVLSVGLQALSAVLFLAVNRLNNVLGYYDSVIFAVRDSFLAAATSGGDVPDLRPFRDPPRSPRGSVSRVAKFVLQAGIAGFPVAVIVALWRAIELTPDSTASIVACSVGLALNVTIWGLCWWALQPRP
jgi:heme/copper-type cytochrome/quinol oxidase subunit 4